MTRYIGSALHLPLHVGNSFWEKSAQLCEAMESSRVHVEGLMWENLNEERHCWARYTYFPGENNFQGPLPIRARLGAIATRGSGRHVTWGSGGCWKFRG